ncbi:NDOR1 (predicted) [Pycnogonum litorale]
MINRSVTVLYGSQTGTAQEVAEHVSREAKRRHFRVLTSSLDDYDVSLLLSESLVVFVCSTTGQGETPDNMKEFWKFLLRKSLPTNSLQNVNFAVIGLGDSSYVKFNFVAKRLHRRLIQLGGRCIHQIALADDQHDVGPDGIITPWLDSFWNVIMTMYPLPSGVEIISSDILPPSKYRVTKFETDDVLLNDRTFVLDPKMFLARVISCQRVTTRDHFQDVRLVKLNIKGSEFNYKPGDVAVVQPKNMDKLVDDFLSLFPHLNPDQLLKVEQNDQSFPLPFFFKVPRTLREIVYRCLDIQSIPKRYFFELLKHFTKSELEREKYEEFCSAEGQEELYTYCNRPKRMIVETLADFPSTTPHIPLDYIFDLIPFVQPRSFSIASSLDASPGELHLLVAVVDYKTKLKESRRGLCSNWLASLHSDDRVPVKVRTSNSFIFPTSDVPVIMVGPGTGVAPFRAFLQQRLVRGIGKNYLFFGCRNKDKDFYCSSEWQQMMDKGLLELFVAFSRDHDEKIYVQHRMQEFSSLIWKLINDRGAFFFIAGSSQRMPQDVTDELCNIICVEGQMSKSEAENYLKELQTRKRFLMDTWS